MLPLRRVGSGSRLQSEGRRLVSLAFLSPKIIQAIGDRDTVRAIIARRKLSEEQRAAADALMNQYMSALGDYASTPLGQAGKPAQRGGEAHAG
jgi:hypothetical protein